MNPFRQTNIGTKTEYNNTTYTLHEAFRHVETLFIQGHQVCTDQNKHPFFISKKGGLF